MEISSDEMNLHVPQSIEAEVEIMVNARAALHIVTPQRNGPVNGAVQDAPVAVYTLTMAWADGTCTMVSRKTALSVYNDAEISIDRVNDLMLRAKKYYPKYIMDRSQVRTSKRHTENETDHSTTKKIKNGIRSNGLNGIKNHADVSLDFADEIPGSLFISILFPPNFCYTRTTEVHPDPKRHDVVIEDGVLLESSGPLCKKTIGAENGSIVHVLWNKSPECALYFLSDLQQVTDRWMPTHGFSMGIADCFASRSQDVAKILIETRSKVSKVIETAESPEQAETEINRILNLGASTVGPKIAKDSMNKGDKNALNIMRCSGAKGSPVNLAQIVAFVGQQNIKGKRMPLWLSHNTRSLPSFLPGDLSPDARGFIENNYITGLTPQEAFFHAGAGRDGVISTSLKTADTGYMQKRLARKMEDLRSWIDGTVRDANGSIVCFAYGSDGMDAKKLMSVKGLTAPFFVNPAFLARQLNSDARRGGGETGELRKLRPREIEQLLTYISFSGSSEKQSTPTAENITNNARNTLRKVLDKLEIYESKIFDLYCSIRDAYTSAKIQYGSMVGLIATASVGEPATQMVLNTFHFAGFKGKDASLGVPRFKEVINTTKTGDQKKPGCTIYFDDEILQKNAKCIVELERKNRELSPNSAQFKINEGIIKQTKEESLALVQSKRSIFQETYVKEFLVDYEMKYLDVVDPETGTSPTGLITYEEYAPEWWVTLARGLDTGTGNTMNDKNPESWVILLKLDVEKLYRQRMELEDIALAIEEQSNGSMTCIPSPTSIGQIEVYVTTSELKGYASAKIELTNGGVVNDNNAEYFLCREVAIDFIKNTQINGIRGISKVYAREDLETREWLLDTDGANFLKILTTPGVDVTRTQVDDMHSIAAVLGIAAARRFLYNELTRIIGFDNVYVNPRHISLLADVMTVKGTLTAASRDGIGRDVGPNAKVLFEKSVDNAMLAATFGEVDGMKSLASSVMYGKLSEAGPGVVIVRNRDKIPTAPPKAPPKVTLMKKKGK